jgi:L-asparaginase / beta-aspartyl-peptidase
MLQFSTFTDKRSNYFMKPALIVHGGAWDWPDEQDKPKAESIKQALAIGWQILQEGGTALDAVEKAINWLEDDPLFDAGTGSHLNADGIVEMDAIIIDAKTRNFGAVAGVSRVRYPISLARLVLEETEHNFFVGSNADALAAQLGMPLVPNISLVTDAELAAYRRKDISGASDTVGAIALDNYGYLAVGTSTGGTPLKIAGRVGDSPLFGAGGYADECGGASATGKGEHAMRVLLSRSVVDEIRHGKDAQAAAECAMSNIEGVFCPSMVGVIVMDKNGGIGAAHTTPKMAHGWIDETGKSCVSMKLGTML